MTPLPITPLVARALCKEALALAYLAREQTISAPLPGAADDLWHMPHLDAMPAIGELVQLIGDLMALTEKLEREPSARVSIPADVAARAHPPAALQPYTAELLATHVREIRRRYERLSRALNDDLSPASAADSGIQMPAAEPADRRSGNQHAGRHALVIDDDEIYRHFVSRALEDQGWTVDDAHDGQMGWQMFQLANYNLVVTDIVMPVQDGLETIPLIRARRPDVRIVAISGGGRLRADYLAAALHFGADRTLPKPFTPANLLAAVEPAGTAVS